jgi:aminoglycoside phosphotransferase (APT) family kinase protein
MERWHSRKQTGEAIDLEGFEALVQDLDLGRRVTNRVELAGGTNLIYRLELDETRAVVLKLYHRGRSGFARERAALTMLQGEVAVPECIAAIEDPSRLGYPAVILEWIEGRPLTSQQPQAGGSQLARELAAFVVKLQARRFVRPGIFGVDGNIPGPFASHRAELTDFFNWALTSGRASRRLGLSRSKRLLDKLSDELELISEIEDLVCLTHGDLKTDNVLVTDEDALVVLDWEFARAGHPLDDVSALFRNGQGRDHRFQQRFIEAYEEFGAAVPVHWRQILSIYDLKFSCGVLNASAHRTEAIEQASEQVDRFLAQPQP